MISADKYIRAHNTVKPYLDSPPLYEGCEIEKNTYRLCLMNAFLHEMDTNIILGDGLTDDANELQDKVNVIIANPPFGSKSGSVRKQKSSIKHPSSNKQLDFLQHIYNGLKSGGRAAVVLPDNVLFEEGIGRTIRQELMDLCDLHTVLRLPTGIFYAAGVKANVLFFTRGKSNKNNTKDVWIYDLRTNMPTFNKGNPLTDVVFTEFIEKFGTSSLGRSKRIDDGVNSRFRNFSNSEIKKLSYNLDISWLPDESIIKSADLPEPDVIAAQLTENLQTTLFEIQELTTILYSAYGSKDE